MHAAQDVKRRLFEHALHRRGDVLVALVTGSSGGARTQAIDQPVGEDVRHVGSPESQVIVISPVQ